jgi:predicted nucleic acid-binding protein
MSEMFLDSSFAIALSATSDQFHRKAVEISGLIEAQSIRLITTHAVLLEIGNALSRQRYRRAAIQLLTSLHADPSIVLVSLSDPLYQRAFQLFEERSDKEWGMTDCLSFVVMEERSVHEALTADHHFRQAGFRALLLEL